MNPPPSRPTRPARAANGLADKLRPGASFPRPHLRDHARPAASPRPWLGAVLGSILAATTSLEAQMTISFSNSTEAVIPDDNANGTSSTLSVVGPAKPIGLVEVDLRVESVDPDNPAYNGDLYIYLAHTDNSRRRHLAVLLNRPGKTSNNTLGYGDSSFQVTFRDNASQGDIHGYRTTLFGNDETPIPFPGRLTGTWSPDGRETDPESVLPSDARTALLSGFQGHDPNGAWTLYLADLSGGGEAKLVSWSLTLVLVPEPSWSLFVAAAALLGWTSVRRRTPTSTPAPLRRDETPARR